MRGRALEANINKRIFTLKLQSLYLIIKTSAPTIPCMALKVQFTSLKQQQGLEKNTIKRSWLNNTQNLKKRKTGRILNHSYYQHHHHHHKHFSGYFLQGFRYLSWVRLILFQDLEIFVAVVTWKEILIFDSQATLSENATWRVMVLI